MKCVGKDLIYMELEDDAKDCLEGVVGILNQKEKSYLLRQQMILDLLMRVVGGQMRVENVGVLSKKREEKFERVRWDR